MAQQDGSNPLALHGHISYLEIPAVDAARSAEFFRVVFSWNIRQVEAHRAAFDDPGGNLIGRFVTGRSISESPGLLPYIYVAKIDEIVVKIQASGGAMVKPVFAEGDLFVATFRDPAGNYLGIWQFGPR